MTIVPPLTREQCQLIVNRYEQHARAMNQAFARLQEAETAHPIEQLPGYIADLRSAYQLAEQEAAASQLLALLALRQLDLTKGAKLL